VILDPPAFAKSKRQVPSALRGYKEINLRAMRLLAPGGRLFTASCSHHVSAADFREMLIAAARNAGREFVFEVPLRQAADHPVLLGHPETEYLKGAVLRRMD
jgi:23S rRNA (cytosine1962-C5)-methyltransferase